ncbi:MAG: hypothetical protein RLZZ84_148, partial [Pseudomonadota bacterium]
MPQPPVAIDPHAYKAMLVGGMMETHMETAGAARDAGTDHNH